MRQILEDTLAKLNICPNCFGFNCFYELKPWHFRVCEKCAYNTHVDEFEPIELMLFFILIFVIMLNLI